mmetsp:Transcript_25886/g.53493  ORF Transcript_25886/g.53493 Transcript_25886/m.53493 type:complete len:239 (+) Transcript_25886:132-848(+)
MHARPAPLGRTAPRTRTYVCTYPRAAHGLDPDRRRAEVRRATGGRDRRRRGKTGAKGKGADDAPEAHRCFHCQPEGAKRVCSMCGTRPGPPSHKRLQQQLCELTDHKHPGQRALPFKAEVPQNGRKARAVDTRLSVRTPRTEQPRRSPRDGQQRPRCFTVTARQHGSSTHSGTRPCGLTPLDSLEPPGERLPLRTSRARRRGNLARRVPKHHGITLPIAWRAHIPAERLIETFRAVEH